MKNNTITLKGIPDVKHVVEMLNRFSSLLDALNNTDDAIKDVLPNEVKEIIREMNIRDYPKTLAQLRVGLKRWDRGYGDRVWRMIERIIDQHDDEVEVSY